MHIIQMTLGLDHGGLEHLAVQLAKKLKDKGHRSTLVCLKKGGVLKIVAERQGIDVFDFDKKEGFDKDLMWRLARLFREQKADVVHTHNFGPLIYGTLAARLAGRPCINTRHGRGNLKANRLIWALNKFAVSVSKDTQEQMLNKNVISRNKAKIIYNGIDLGKYPGNADPQKIPALKKELGIAEDRFVIGTVGRLAKEKDQETLLKAFRKLIKKEARVALVIVGDGPLREQLTGFCRENGLTDHVRFLGFREDIHDILGVFDVFVLSSVMEGVPLTILEAMAASKPVIATKVGGNPEVVLEGETGYLVPCGFPERIETAVMRFYVKRELIKKLGDAGRRRVEEMFNLEKMAGEYEELYRRCVSRGRVTES